LIFVPGRTCRAFNAASAPRVPDGLAYGDEILLGKADHLNQRVYPNIYFVK
jgi:hypothetical protein